VSGRAATRPAADREPRVAADRGAGGRSTEPCLHCGHPVPARLMGCKGGHCPNCRHPYPHGDCSD